MDQAGVMGSAGGKWVRLDEPLNLGSYFLLPPPYAILTISNGVTQASRNLIADAAKLSWSTNQALRPFIKSLVGAGTQRVLTWYGSAGDVYRVQGKTNLSDATWTDLSANITASDTTTTWTNDVSGTPQRFYRVMRQ